MKSPFEIKKEICEIARRIYNDGFVAANDGNISVKVNDNELAIGLFAPKTTFDLENTYIVSKGVGELYNTLSAGQNYSLVAGAESILQVV